VTSNLPSRDKRGFSSIVDMRAQYTGWFDARKPATELLESVAGWTHRSHRSARVVAASGPRDDLGLPRVARWVRRQKETLCYFLC
jgi:hypothetical protein